MINVVNVSNVVNVANVSNVANLSNVVNVANVSNVANVTKVVNVAGTGLLDALIFKIIEPALVLPFQRLCHCSFAAKMSVSFIFNLKYWFSILKYKKYPSIGLVKCLFTVKKCCPFVNCGTVVALQ